MEVPRRPQPSFTLALPKPASSALSPIGAVEKVAKMDGTADGDQFGGETEEESNESVFVETPDETSELVDTNVKLTSQDSFSKESSISEERLAEMEEEARKKSEEEEAASKERAAQRQMLSIEELVQSERNYLRLLQVSTVTIRSNLQKLQVGMKCV